MKVLVGIDLAGVYEPALDFVFALGLHQPEVILANCIDSSLGPMYDYGVYPLLGVDVDQYATDLGRQALDRAARQALVHGAKAEMVSLIGPRTKTLIGLADDRGVDLIAVQSQRKSSMGNLFLGSVSRGLVIGAHQSIFISKLDVVSERPIRAVFATDHSAYANRALQKLLEFAPVGIKSIHVVAAFATGDVDQIARLFEIAGVGDNAQDQIARDLEKRNEHLVGQLKNSGYDATHAVVLGSAQSAIQEVMSATQASLLIMGAQGHGFMHRLFVGSNSLHHAVSEPYSLLLLRPPTSNPGEE